MLLLLAWRANLDGYDMALAANRLAARGVPLWWLGTAGPNHEPGDYLCDVGADDAERLGGFGVVATRWNAPLPDGAVGLAPPRIALLAGEAAPFPDFAYYAMALARLGFDFELVDGGRLAAAGLAGRDIVVLPGGKAIWGLDAAEGVAGADARVRDFLAGGGGAVGSGEGAFYLSSGRPGWTGTARVRPRHTPEYLRTGIGIVALRMGADSIGFGCPPVVELPYYHGPVYDELDRSAWSAATFDRLVTGGHLLVANALDDEAFRRELGGHTAILRAEGPRGRAVLFSPRPEMGDLVRKYIAFDGYVARYLPIVGEAAMADALRHYQPLESPPWRMILNAIHSLMLRRRPPALPPAPIAAAPSDDAPRLVPAAARAVAALPSPQQGPHSALERLLRDDLSRRLNELASRREKAVAALAPLAGPAGAMIALLANAERAAAVSLEREGPSVMSLSERLISIDTAVTMLEAWCRLAEAELHFAPPPARQIEHPR